jgi:hypothetical protein
VACNDDLHGTSRDQGSPEEVPGPTSREGIAVETGAVKNSPYPLFPMDICFLHVWETTAGSHTAVTCKTRPRVNASKGVSS